MLNTDLLDMATICLRLNKTRQTIYAWVKAGKFPKPYQPGGKNGHYFWTRQTVEKWEARLTK